LLLNGPLVMILVASPLFAVGLRASFRILRLDPAPFRKCLVAGAVPGVVGTVQMGIAQRLSDSSDPFGPGLDPRILVPCSFVVFAVLTKFLFHLPPLRAAALAGITFGVVFLGGIVLTLGPLLLAPAAVSVGKLFGG